MKRSLSCLLFALFLVSCGGGDDGAGPGNGGNNNPPTAQPTATGTPDGPSTSQTIGASGGSVTSDDGLFTLTVPAGALNADTLVTVQPITNMAWGGIGKGYRLTPHGLHFNAPVSLAFSVAPEDLVESGPEFLDVAVQDDQGLWYILKNSSYDDVAQTMTATTTHFSDYSNIEGLQIRPASASVSTLGTVDLHVRYCHTITIPGDDDLIALLYSCDDDLIPLGTFSNWSVDGVKGGSVSAGHVVELGSTEARYTAPSSIPGHNPVAVSVEAKGRRGTKTLLVSNITVSGDFFGVITRTTGSGVPGEKAIWTMTWKSLGAAGGFEEFTGQGVLEYTAPDCTGVSPANAPVQTAYMIIDRTKSAPYHVVIGIETAWLAHICSLCVDPVTCVDEDYYAGFADSGVGTISADGSTISGHFFDGGNGEDWTYSFTRTAPSR